MISVGALFLLGATLVSGNVIRESYPYPPAIIHEEYGLPIQVSRNGAFISVDHSNCGHANQIISASIPLPEYTPLAPIIVEEPKEPIIIPEAPQLGPFVIPEFKIRVAEQNEFLNVPEAPKPVIEELTYIPEARSDIPAPVVLAPYPAESIEITHENCGTILPSGSELPAVIPIEIEAPKETIIIPEAPELGPFTLPEFSIRLNVPEPVVLAPYPAVTYVPGPPAPIEIEAPKAPVWIPEAPILEPLVLPELPARVNVIKSADFIAEKEECEHGPFIDLPAPEPVFIEAPKAPVVIPAAPELGPFVLPGLPTRFEVPKAPVIIEAPNVPFDIPEAPELGPFVLPKFPVKTEIPEASVIIEEPKAPIIIPAAPELGPFVWPDFPVRVEAPWAPVTITEKESPAPVIFEETKAPFFIPTAPELGPFVLPEFTVRVEVPEAPILIAEKEDCKHSKVIEVPAPSPVIIEEPKAPFNIPEAPELGPFLLPEFPVRVEYPEAPVIIEEPKAPIVIPEAPELQPFMLPEFPVRVEYPEAPVIIEEPKAPIVIPEAPELGPLVLTEYPVNIEVPKAPVIIEEQKASVIIPEAPELGSFVLPEFPVRVEVPKLPVSFEAIENNEIPFTNETPAPSLVVIPEAPVLPPLVFPKIPENVITILPEAPKLAAQCVHNIVEARVLPAMLDDNYLQNLVAIPAAPELPPLSAYIPAIETNYIPGRPAETYGPPL